MSASSHRLSLSRDRVWARRIWDCTCIVRYAAEGSTNPIKRRDDDVSLRVGLNDAVGWMRFIPAT
jgi:hypothetical protein